MKFKEEYSRLNPEQKKAVDAIDGPVLVIAGPGTGKTQLLATRVANILRQPEISPVNVLCLTFTDNAARNMLDRLEKMIGQPAYHVGVHTFHSFGLDIVNQYPDFFVDRPLIQAVDELGKYEILRNIMEGLPHSDPLAIKVGDEFVYIKDILGAISWLKHNALSPDELSNIITSNENFFTAAADHFRSVFTSIPSPKYLSEYTMLCASLTPHIDETLKHGFVDYARLCQATLRSAIEETESSGRNAPKITAWRNAWLEKDEHGKYVLKDSGLSLKKLKSLSKIYRAFQADLSTHGLYDFDDMVMEVVHALEQHADLRLNLQERYQYVLVDEFQDTNKAQLRLLEALGNNPVNEGRPNILVVGDPNQAIYAFQGALTSNVTTFMNSYKDVLVVSLVDNYRSTQTILDASAALLSYNSENKDTELLDKIMNLRARAVLPADKLEHCVFPSELQQYQSIADSIKKYLQKGYQPSEIAVIAPKHKYLERLMPYLAHADLPVAYERRENILDAPIILQLLRMAELVDALATARHDDADALFGEVLSFPFWGIQTDDLVDISLSAYDKQSHWLPILLRHPGKNLTAIALWFVETAKLAPTEPMEHIIDRLSGAEKEGAEVFVSPFRDYYFNNTNFETAPSDYLSHLGQLSTLRENIRRWRPDTMLQIKDLVEFVRLHRQAKLKIVDTNPHTQSTNAVQVMTAYKAKGLEFDIVFVINTQDEVWGPTARSKSERIRLPKNLPLKPAGETDDDKLRLLFVALTRARHSLHIMSYTHTLNNKLSLGLSFLRGNTVEDNVVHPAFTPQHMAQALSTEAVEILSTDWAYRYKQVIADKPALFEPILTQYKLSVTHLNNFLDVVNGGPRYFLLHNLLRFPAAMSPNAAYGDAVHKTLQWVYVSHRNAGSLPSNKAVREYFSDMLSRRHLPQNDFKRFNKRGIEALTKYLKERGSQFAVDHIIERGFTNEGVYIENAHLSGKIDKIVLLPAGNVQVIDFKTGKPSTSWQGGDDYEKRKLHRYEQQLMFYKLLVEHSASFKAKMIATKGGLDFIEAGNNGKLTPLLELDYDTYKLAEFTRLIQIVWHHITELNFPDTSGYTQDYSGLLAFEQNLLDGKI